MNANPLSDTYLLRGASPEQIARLESVCSVVEFVPGATIVAVNDKNQDLMIVLSGKARVQTREGDLIDEVRAGGMLGEIAFLDGHARTANVTAVGDTRIFVIPSGALRELMRDDSEFERVILRNAALALCQRLREANQQIEGLLLPR